MCTARPQRGARGPKAAGLRHRVEKKKVKKKVLRSLCLYNLKPPVFKFGLDTYFCSAPVSASAHGTHMLASVERGDLVFNVTPNLQSWTKLTKIVE